MTDAPRAPFLPAVLAFLAAVAGWGSVSAQEIEGWPLVGPEMVRQIEASRTVPHGMQAAPVVDVGSFAEAGAARGWPATERGSWWEHLGEHVGLDLPPRVATGTCEANCPYEGEPRIYRLMELTRTLPQGLERHLGTLPEGHLLAVVRVEFNIGSSGDRFWRSGYHEHFFVLGPEAAGGPRIVSRVELVRIATGGRP